MIHLHSTYSDGTGTVAEIAEAGQRSAVDVVLLTDHDSLEARRRGDEGWYGETLLLAGHEVSPLQHNHYLAFGLDEELDHRDLSPAQIVEAVRDRGGFGFAAHPFSEGSKRFSRFRSMSWQALDCLDGIELWSFLSDNGERAASIRDVVRFVVFPERYVTHPPQRNLDEWDRMCARRRVVGVGGLDAHQIGRRVRGRVVRLMGYERAFRQLRTHVLCERAPTGDLEHDRELVFEALRAGRCYIAAHAVAPARGFRFFAERPDGGRLEMGDEAEHSPGWTLRAAVPRAADIRLLRDGAEVARRAAPALVHRVGEPGAYRVEVRLRSRGAERTWLLSNPVYLRPAAG